MPNIQKGTFAVEEEEIGSSAVGRTITFCCHEFGDKLPCHLSNMICARTREICGEFKCKDLFLKPDWLSQIF